MSSLHIAAGVLFLYSSMHSEQSSVYFLHSSVCFCRVELSVF